jgi:hypothetical protein
LLPKWRHYTKTRSFVSSAYLYGPAQLNKNNFKKTGLAPSHNNLFAAMGVDSSEKYTLFFLALCTLCLTTTIIIYCHHADHTSKEESLDEIKAQVDVLRERVTDLLLEVEQGGGGTHNNKLDIGDGQPRIERPAGHVKVDRRKVYATLYHNTANDVGYVWGLRYDFPTKERKRRKKE